MKNINQLMKDIIDLSGDIETKYPELYKYLDETPISFTGKPGQDISVQELENYLNSLKEQLRNHIYTHDIKN